MIQRDIRNLKAALANAGKTAEDAFMTAVVTGVSILPGEYYKSLEEQATAVAEAMREEYRAIVDAGFILQVDDPELATHYVLHPEASIDECRRTAEGRH